MNNGLKPLETQKKQLNIISEEEQSPKVVRSVPHPEKSTASLLVSPQNQPFFLLQPSPDPVPYLKINDQSQLILPGSASSSSNELYKGANGGSVSSNVSRNSILDFHNPDEAPDKEIPESQDATPKTLTRQSSALIEPEVGTSLKKQAKSNQKPNHNITESPHLLPPSLGSHTPIAGKRRSSIVATLQTAATMVRSFATKRQKSKFVSKVQKVIRMQGKKQFTLVDEESGYLFDSVLEFKDAGNSYTEASKKFCRNANADAILKLVYGASLYDFILKYSEGWGGDNKNLREEFEDELVAKGIFLETESSSRSSSVYLKLIVPFSVLCETAEKMQIQMPLFDERNSVKRPVNKLQHRTSSGDVLQFAKTSLGTMGIVSYSDGRAPAVNFKQDQISHFQGGNEAITPFHLIQQNFFSNSKRILIAFHILTHLNESGVHDSDNINIFKLLKNKVYSDFYPTHDGPCELERRFSNLRSELLRSWVHRPFSNQPIDEIREYFGEKTAFFFAWMEHYTLFLIPVSILSLFVCIYGIIKISYRQDESMNATQTFYANIQDLFDNEATLLFAILMTIWSTFLLQFWKRRSNTLAYRWGVLKYETEEMTRPDWIGTHARKSKVTGKYELYFPNHKYYFRLFISSLVGIGSMSIVLVMVLLVILLRVYVNKLDGPVLVAPLVSLIVMISLKRIYRVIALMLTTWENHKTESSFRDSLALKEFRFAFVNSYCSLFYLAIVKEYSGNNIFGTGWNDTCSATCFVDLVIQLSIFVVKHPLVNIKNIIEQILTRQIYFSYIVKNNRIQDKCSSKNLVDSTGELKNKLPQYILDDSLKGEVNVDRELDEMAIQYGFTVLFVTVFPIAPIIALLNNVFEIRSSAYRFLKTCKRVVPMKSSGLGIWNNIFSGLSYFAVLSNACLIAFSSSTFESRFVVDRSAHWVLAIRLLFIIGYEHIAYFLKVVIASAIPEMTEEVENGIAQQKYQSSLLFEGANPMKDDPRALALLGIDIHNSKNIMSPKRGPSVTENELGPLREVVITSRIN